MPRTPATRILLQDNSPAAGPGLVSLAGFIRNSMGIGWPTMRTFGSYALVYVHSGKGVYSDARGSHHEISAGHCITVFPDIPHRYGPARPSHAEPQHSNWCEFYIVFNGPFAHAWRDTLALDPHNPVRRLDPVPYWLQRFTACANRALSSWQRICLLQQLLVDAHEAHAQDRPHDQPPHNLFWLPKAKRLLESLPSDSAPPLDMPAIARHVGLGYELFRKSFTRSVGISPARYRMQHRINEVSRQLLAPNATLRQIAHRLGFCDEFHLSRCYRKITGRSPDQFRSQVGHARKQKTSA